MDRLWKNRISAGAGHKPNSVSLQAETAVIHLVPGSLQGSSGLPKSIGRAVLHPFRERFSI
jgi:hypothetical protein